jgi:Right handed beta helix region
MTKIKPSLAFLVFMLNAFSSSAKIWRVNNNIGTVANFTNLSMTISNAMVKDGDTIYIEPSNLSYGSASFNKRLVVIGVGYLLDPAAGGNEGLQAGILTSKLAGLNISNGANNSKFYGIQFSGSTTINVSATAYNLLFEKCFMTGLYFLAGAHDGITIRKCYGNSSFTLTGSSQAVISNCVVENCIMDALGNGIAFSNFSTTGCMIRNNVIKGILQTKNAYVANNIFISASNASLTTCTVKNNLFSNAQTLPAGAVGNKLSQAEVNVFILTGSNDAKFKLKAGSPAIAAGVTIGSITPDCGAFGSTDPYKLSGIPAIPSIYILTAPASIPSASAAMNIMFSTRNNN